MSIVTKNTRKRRRLRSCRRVVQVDELDPSFDELYFSVRKNEGMKVLSINTGWHKKRYLSSGQVLYRTFLCPEVEPVEWWVDEDA